MVAQCRQPSLSTAVLKPSGIRGASRSLVALQAGHGAPEAPQPQAPSPSHGRSAWRSHIHALSWQSVQLIDNTRQKNPGLRSTP
jgi:hypothetical protein